MTGCAAPRLVWIPRPAEDAASIAVEIERYGLTPLIEPVLTIRYLDGNPDLDGVTGLLFTSANGVRAFARATPRRDLPVFTVGAQTAGTAHQAGFDDVAAAAGDVVSLAETVSNARRPEDGILLHVAGTVQAGDLAGILEARGFSIRRAILYAAAAAEVLPPTVAGAVRKGAVSAVLLFSPRTAETVAKLVEKAGLAGKLGSVHAIALSAAVAAKIDTLPWAKIAVSPCPERISLLHTMLNALNMPAGKSYSLSDCVSRVDFGTK